jgi:hypothetical protein
MTYTFSEVYLQIAWKWVSTLGVKLPTLHKGIRKTREKQNLIGLGSDIWKVFKLCKWLQEPIPFA